MVPKKSLSFGGGLRSGPDDGSLIKASKRLARYPQIQLRHQVVALLSVTIAVKHERRQRERRRRPRRRRLLNLHCDR